MRILFFCLCMLLAWHSQANDATEAFKMEPLSAQTWKEDSWKSSTEGLVYKPKRVEPTVNNRPNPDFDIDLPDWNLSELDFKTIVRVLLIGILFIVIVAFVYKLGGGTLTRNRELKEIAYDNLEDLEANLERANVDPLLQKALAELDYRLALRLHYLKLIKLLAKKGFIKWQRDKTNGAYLLEIQKQPFYTEVKNLTLAFEYVWFSKHLEFAAEIYQKAAPSFEALYKQIETDHE